MFVATGATRGRIGAEGVSTFVTVVEVARQSNGVWSDTLFRWRVRPLEPRLKGAGPPAAVGSRARPCQLVPDAATPLRQAPAKPRRL